MWLHTLNDKECKNKKYTDADGNNKISVYVRVRVNDKGRHDTLQPVCSKSIFQWWYES